MPGLRFKGNKSRVQIGSESKLMAGCLILKYFAHIRVGGTVRGKEEVEMRSEWQAKATLKCKSATSNGSLLHREWRAPTWRKGGQDIVFKI